MKLPEVGTRIILDNGDVLKVYHAMTDGSGCYVCDNGKKQCYYSDKPEECMKQMCHTNDIRPPFFTPSYQIVFIKED